MKAYRGCRSLGAGTYMRQHTHTHTAFVIAVIGASDGAPSCPSHFIPKVRAPGTYMGPRASLDILEKTETSCLC